MSEYIEIEPEMGEDPAVIIFITNLQLSSREEEIEIYNSTAEMEEGTPIAQALAPITGIRQLILEDNELTITRDLDIPWHAIVSDVTATLTDFFL